MFPRYVGVAAGPCARRGSAKCQDIRPERGDTLGTKLSVNEVQMRANDNDSRVRGASLENTHMNTNTLKQVPFMSIKKLHYQ